MSAPSTEPLFGRAVPRLEDAKLVTGRGRYLDDLNPPGCLAAAVLRSPHAHATVGAIDTAAARALPGVVAVYTAADLAPRLTSPLLVVALPSAAFKLQVDRPVLAAGEVTHVGEPLAVVVAESRAIAEDALDLIEVDYTPCPAVADCRTALDADAPRAHNSLPHNCVAEFGFHYGPVTQAFASAPVIVSGSYALHRGGSHSLEGRGVLAQPDPMSGRLEVWSSTQTPMALKKILCDMLGQPEEAVAVHTPDLGGGFGPKLVTYPEEVAVAAIALDLDCPVKWVEDRREHFISTTQERDQFWDMELALDAEGHILGLRGRLIHDHGAYTARGLNVAYGSGVTVPLPYNVPAYGLDIAVVLTNKVPVTAVRGAGQPQAAFVMERLMDRAAAATGLSRDEIRRRNLVRPEQMPCDKKLPLRGGTNVVLDSGDYPRSQAMALEKSGWTDFASRRAAALKEGRLLGIGLANYVEGTGRGPYETVGVRLSHQGTILVTTGAAAMGQGTATTLAQIVGEQLGRDISLVSVRTGVTDGNLGFGGFNSRQTVVAGASAHLAAARLREKILKVAAHMMEAHEDDLDIADGAVFLKGVADKRITFRTIAAAAAGLPGYKLPGIEKPGLEFTEQVIIDDMAYSNGSAVAEVEVDAATGRVAVRRLTLAHDCGRMVNPRLVDGQILGGVAHGLGNALFERMAYDEEAQPLTATFADYLLVTSAEMPKVDIVHTESPSPLNPLGVKGVGESGVIPTAAAIASAIDDALGEAGTHVSFAPISPPALLAEIRRAAALREADHG